MKKVVNRLGVLGIEVRNLVQGFRAGLLDFDKAAEMPEQGFLLDLPDPGDLVQDRLEAALAPQFFMKSDGEAMGFVPDPLQVAQ
jgi:hypothetical protein